MGTWGPKNLDSDGALDCLGEYSSKLLDEIKTLVASPESTDPWEYDYDQLFVLFEVLFALEARYLFSDYLTPDEARELKETYLNNWDAARSAAESGWDDRRREISRTFDHLIYICEIEEQRFDASPSWAPVEPPNLNEIIPDLVFVPHIALGCVTVSLPQRWDASVDSDSDGAFQRTLCSQIVNSEGILLGADGGGGKLVRKFYASGRSFVPDEVKPKFDPYLLIGVLEFDSENDCPMEHSLTWATQETLEKDYQDEGEHIGGAYGLDIQDCYRFVGVNTFRHLVKGPEWGTRLFHQDLYYHRISAQSVLVLEFGSIQDNCDRNFPDGVLVRELCNTLAPTSIE